MKRLTPRQEKFVRGLVAGLSQRAAYSEAYNVSKWAPATIDSRAANLAAQEKVVARLAELIAEAAADAKWDRRRAAAIHEDSLARIVAEFDRIDAAGDPVPSALLRERRETVAEVCKLYRIYDEGLESADRITIIFDV